MSYGNTKLQRHRKKVWSIGMTSAVKVPRVETVDAYRSYSFVHRQVEYVVWSHSNVQSILALGSEGVLNMHALAIVGA
jgi:hypothetical protein